jgi:hypothetical protein
MAARAEKLVTEIRTAVDPVANKILEMADKADRSPDDEKALGRLDEQLTDRIRQSDSIAEIAESAIALFNKTSRLAASLPRPRSRIAAGLATAEDPQVTSDALSRLAMKLKELREVLAKLRSIKQVPRVIADDIVHVAGDVVEKLNLIDARLQRVANAAMEWRTEIAESRASIAAWTNEAAVIGSLVLAWMGLGQFVLLRQVWGWIRS